MQKTLLTLALTSLLFVGACGESETVSAPDPIALPDDALGYFCGMTVKMHDGPKGQIFLKDQAEPIWFVSVRDTLAFTRLPDEAHRVKPCL